MQVTQSAKLANVCYDIRGPVLDRGQAHGGRGPPDPQAQHRQPGAVRLRGAGGDPPGRHPATCPPPHGYGDSKGLLSARRAVVQYYQQKGVDGVDVEDVYLGNGVSELIVMALQALLDDGDEVLIPAPDYPLWTAAVDPVPAAGRCTTCATSRPDWLPGPRRHRAPRSPTAPGPWWSSTRTTRPARCTPREVLEGIARARPPARPGGALRRDLRQDPLRRRDAHPDRRPGARPAVPHLQRAVQGVPGGRVPLRLAGRVRARSSTPQSYIEGLDHAGQHAAVPQRADPVRHPDRARRPPEHQRPGPARRPAARAARPGLGAAQRHPRV